ncbi:GPW/gp25 family protein [Megalodesulfovibrio paquesii]
MGMETTLILRSRPEALLIGATGVEDIMQCVQLIILTHLGSVVLDRTFAGDGSYIDQPGPMGAARAMASLAEAIERHEPRVRVKRIELPADQAANADGAFFPVVTITIKAGAL